MTIDLPEATNNVGMSIELAVHAISQPGLRRGAGGGVWVTVHQPLRSSLRSASDAAGSSGTPAASSSDLVGKGAWTLALHVDTATSERKQRRREHQYAQYV